MIKIAKLTPELKKEHWGDGLWVNEPDFEEFEHSGLVCFIRRVAGWEGPEGDHLYGGHWCGYVVIPKDHPLFGKEDFFFPDLNVHGGVTYSDFEPVDWGDPTRFVIGFDCAHSEDEIPSMIANRKIIQEEVIKGISERLRSYMDNSPFFNPTYKTYGFVLEEVKSLAEQIKAAYNPCDMSNNSH